MNKLTLQKFRPRSLRAKLILLTVSMISLALLLTGIFNYIYSRRQTLDAIILQKQTLARITAANSQAALVFGIKQDAERILANLNQSSSLHFAQLIDIDGNVLAEVKATECASCLPLPADDELLLAQTEIADQCLMIITPVYDQRDNIIGALRITEDLRWFHQIEEDRIAAIVLLTIIVLILSTAIAVRIQANVMTPITMLANTAESIMTNHKDNIRAPLIADDHETNHLTHAFNNMLDTIDNRNRELKHERQQTEIRAQEAESARDALRLEIELKNKVQHQLAISENRFAAFMQHLQAIVCIRQHDGTIVYANPMFCKHFDNLPHLKEVFPFSNRNAANAAYTRLQKQPVFHVEKSYTLDNEKDKRWFSTQVFSIPQPQNQPELIGFISLDFTQRKNELAEQAQMEEQVRQTQKLESLGVLAGGIAHDFNNLLVGILGNVELALQEDAQNSNNIYLTDIRDTACQAANLCKQMLAYAGKGTTDSEVINVPALTIDIAQLISVSLAKNVTLEYNLADDTPTTKADPSQIRQVIMNLIINASEACGPQGGTIKLSTAAFHGRPQELSNQQIMNATDEHQDHFVHITVEDTGCGMSSDTLHKIFDPFFTTKFTGRGLGLAAVVGIINRHQGAICVSSTEGQGTRFEILLPFCQAPHCGIDAKTATANSPNQTARGQVLLVDDEATVRNIGTKMLTKAGFTVHTAANGMEAVNCLKKQEVAFDAVVLDLTMPIMSGQEAYQKIRQIDKDITVIFSSGYNSVALDDITDNDERVGFIQKPYLFAELTQGVQQLISKHTANPA